MNNTILKYVFYILILFFDIMILFSFLDIVGPLLSTVRLHPLLVTQGKDFEKTNARWKVVRHF